MFSSPFLFWPSAPSVYLQGCLGFSGLINKLPFTNQKKISSIANLKQLGMDISFYGGQMSTLKDELVSILPKSTNTKTSLSKMDRVFMIILLLNLEPDFENIREQILT